MLSTKNTKNMKYLCIVGVLKDLRLQNIITDTEFKRACQYYEKATGADIILPE